MGSQFEAVELWRNHTGDMMRRTMVYAPDRPPTRVIDNLSLRQKSWSFGGWAAKVPAYDPKYSEYDAAKEAARFTDTPFALMRDLLHLGQVFSYQKKSEIPIEAVIDIGLDNTFSQYLVRKGHFDTRLTIFLMWHARQERAKQHLE